MSKDNLLLGFILGLMGTFFLLSAGKTQGRIPACLPLGETLKVIEPLREMNWVDDTITVQASFPSTFRETGRNEVIDSIALLTSVFGRLRQVHTGLSESTVRILHIGDSHVRGHIYPQTTGTLLKEAFGAVPYTDMGMNEATCLTSTRPKRIADIVTMKPELLILSLGTNESRNWQYNVNLHYNQMDGLAKLLHDGLPDVSVLLTTPPGSYESFRQRRRECTYAINPRTVIATETIRRYAKDHRLLVWDMYDVAGGKHRTCTNQTEAKLIHPDHVYYLPGGYVLQGNLLYQAIIQAYNDYVSYWYWFQPVKGGAYLRSAGTNDIQQ